MTRINGNADRRCATGLTSVSAAPLLRTPQLGGEPQPKQSPPPQQVGGGLAKERTSDPSGGDTSDYVWSERGRKGFGMVKSVTEWWAALVLALLVSPVVLLLAFAVWFETGGPVFYRGDRVGRNGYWFGMWKLRTMHVGAGDLVQKTPDDPRVTRVGRLLRRTSLDELPQLWNVLAGDMALVGPRPHCLYEAQRLGPVGARRLRVKPGMTGLWQTQGRNDLSKAEQIRLDLDYLNGWSLWLDLRILARTVPSVLKARGAY